MNTKVTALVLAAGKGTRMKSNKAKVLHEIFFAPMIHHVLDALHSLKLAELVVITGHQQAEVENALQGFKVSFVEQHEQLGTGHAVQCTAPMFAGNDRTVLILCGDTPLIRTKTLACMLHDHVANHARLTVMTTRLDNPTNYGRAVVDDNGFLLRIVEEKDATAAEKSIQEINAGIYCVSSTLLFELLQKIGTDNQQGEMYLTDIVELAQHAGLPVNRFLCAEADEVLGVNSRVELAEAHQALQMRRNRELMLAGVTLPQPGSVFIEKTVTIGRDTIIHPNSHIAGKTHIGEGCNIGPFVMLNNCQIGDNATIGAFHVLDDITVEAGSTVESRCKG